MKNQYLEIAKIINTHGIRGDMKLELWCDSPAVIKKIHTLYLDKEGKKPLHITNPRMHGAFLLLHADGIDTPEAAALYKETVLYANRDDVPHGENDFFIADILGLPVIHADTGEKLGILHDVLENPANPIYEVATADGTVLLPVVKEFIIRIAPPDGIFVRPIPGMFTEAHFTEPDADTERDGHAI